MPRKLIKSEEIILPQKHMSMGAFVWLIIAMMTVQWMTLDMYLPALPVLKEEFGASEAVLNFSLNSDLILCAIGTLVGGTISDKYGRRPIMLLGLALSAAALLMAAMSQGIVMLTIMRGLCGLGGGFALTVASAIIRDSFEGDSFQMVTTLTQSAAIIGPIVAPAAGAFLIEYLSWRWIFIVLGTATVLTLIPFFFTLETWPAEKRQVGSVWQATLQSFNLVRRFEFVVFMVHVDNDVTGLIERKVVEINRELADTSDGLPPLSVSVGVALGQKDLDAKEVFHEADTALYFVKDHGRNGCCFYHEIAAGG